MQRLRNFLARPIDIAPLVFFRIVGGSLMTIELTGHWLTSFRASYLDQPVHFYFTGFSWISPPAPPLMMGIFVLSTLLGIAFVLGWRFKWVSLLWSLNTFAILLMEKTMYINHTYLYGLLIFLMHFTPAHRAYSLDVKRDPTLRSGTAPAYYLYSILLQFSIIYLYAGFAKLFDPDWRLAKPLMVWFHHFEQTHPFGSWFSSPYLPWIYAYAGMLFDLLVVPGMLWKRTRKFTFIAAIFFHAGNAVTFGVGTFPWLSLTVTSLFFSPGYFRKVFFLQDKLPPLSRSFHGRAAVARYILPLFFLVQIVLPLRPYLYPGYASWTEEGHYFAWRMMLRTKAATLRYRIVDEKQDLDEFHEPDERLSRRSFLDMRSKPELIVQYAHYLAKEYEQRGFEPSVYAITNVSLNGGSFQPIVPANLDLTGVKLGLWPYSWILPVKEDALP